MAGYLADHPGVDFTPGQIARALSGRSSGAVANALVVLTGLGAAEQTGERPTRFRATPGSATVAAAPPVIVTGLAPGLAPVPSPAATGRARSGRAPVTPTGAGTVARIGLAGGATPDPVVDPVTGAVLRPNGQAYHPRQLADGSDIDALRKLRAAGVSVLLYGPPGTGKTSVVEAAFPDLITVAGDGDTTVADLVGEYTQTPEGRYVFVHGPLVRAMREGRALLFDDATLIPPTVLAVAYPAMDGRREIVVKANGGEIVTAQPGFYVIAGHNPGVHGAVLTDALSSRFALQVQVSTDYDLAKQLKIDRRAVRAAKNLATRAERGEIGWAPQLRELIAFQRVGDRARGRGRHREPGRDRPRRGPRHRRHGGAHRVRHRRHPAGPRPTSHPTHPDRPGHSRSYGRRIRDGRPRSERPDQHRPTGRPAMSTHVITEPPDTTRHDRPTPTAHHATPRPGVRPRMARDGGTRSPGR